MCFAKIQMHIENSPKTSVCTLVGKEHSSGGNHAQST